MKRYLIQAVIILFILTIGISCTHQGATVNVPGNQGEQPNIGEEQPGNPPEETSINQGQAGSAMAIEGFTITKRVYPTDKSFNGETSGLFVTYDPLKGGPFEDVQSLVIYLVAFESSDAALQLWNSGQECTGNTKHDSYYNDNKSIIACVDNGFPNSSSTKYNPGRLDLLVVKGNQLLSFSCQISPEANVDKTSKMHQVAQNAIDAYLR